MKRMLFTLAMVACLALMGFTTAATEAGEPLSAEPTASPHSALQDGLPPRRTEAELRYEVAYTLWLADVVEQATLGADPEHLLAAAVIAATPGLFGLDVDAASVDEVFARAHAASALRPDLLATLESACSALRDPLILFDRKHSRAVPEVCADVDLAEQASAIEPANAFHWARRAGNALKHGDAPAARAYLLASGQSSHWKTPHRDRIAVLWRAFMHWPPGNAMADASDLVDAESAGRHASDVIARAYKTAWRDPEVRAALHAQGVAAQHTDAAHGAALRLCGDAAAAGDAMLVAICRRLGRMWVDSSDTIGGVLASYRMQIVTEPPSASARAEHELAAFREHGYSAYWRALRDHDIEPDLLADIRNLIEYGEIEMMRRGLARVEAQVAANPDRNAQATAAVPSVAGDRGDRP